MTNLVERLRAWVWIEPPRDYDPEERHHPAICDEAADEIDRLSRDASTYKTEYEAWRKRAEQAEAQCNIATDALKEIAGRCYNRLQAVDDVQPVYQHSST